MGEFTMHKRVELFVAAAVAAAVGVAQPAAAQPSPAPPAAPPGTSVSVPREVLERYVGRYELNGAILTVGLTGDGRLTAELSGQPPGPPMRTVSANEFAADAVGVRLFFEGEGPKATRIRSRYNGSEVVGSRIADAPGASPTAAAPPAAGVVRAIVEPALEGVFRAFENHPIVALGEAHGLAAQMDFYTAVVRDPRFARDVRNLVVEFGASSQQQVIDRYVAGETVPYAELRKVWNDTVGWAPPPALVGFAKFFAAVRDINKSLPPGRQIKVWLGEPPLDWTAPSRDEIMAAVSARDTYPAGLIRDRILAKGEKALVIYGAGHLARGPSLKGQLDATHPGAMFAILPYAPPFQYPGCAPLLSQVTAIWPQPALATRSRGEADAGLRECFTLSPPAGGPGPRGPGPGPGGPGPGPGGPGPGPGGPGPGPGPGGRGLPPTVEGDGVLFLGALGTLAQGPLLPDYLLDPELRREIGRRSDLGGLPLLPAPSGLAIRKADYAFDLDAPGYREHIEKIFAAHDRDGDGVIIIGEYDVAQPAAAQSAAASPAAPAEASVSVPREVLERYVGRYDFNGTIATVALTEDGQLTSQLAGQPPTPLRAVSTSEFVADAVGARLFFEGEGPKATRIRSRWNGSELVGPRIADAPGASPSAAAPPAPLAAPLDAAARQAVVTQLGTALRDRYVFPDVGEQAAARIDAALAAGEYDGLDHPAFAARLNSDVAAIAHDKHFNVGWQGGPPPGPPGAVAMPRMEAGVVRADRLAGGIGYIEVVAFPPPVAFKPALDRAMAGLAGSKALIIDIRRNGGGSPPAVGYLVSYLLAADTRVHINDIVGRTPGTTDFTRVSSYSEPTPASFAGVPVYVLTSSRTFSGGEEFAYDVKALGRATLVGELTGGGANPTGGVPLGNGFVASIPFGRPENPITGSNWEGHGVDPDIAVPAGEALGVALERLGAEPAADIAAASREQVFAPRSVPTAGTEAALRSFVAGLASGSPDYDKLSPQFAEVVRQQLPRTQGLFASLGELKSVTYREPGVMGGDTYDVVFANGGLIMSVGLDADGKIAGGAIQPVGPPGR